jgi:guanyl-specific ribonuclease Sa
MRADMPARDGATIMQKQSHGASMHTLSTSSGSSAPTASLSAERGVQVAKDVISARLRPQITAVGLAADQVPDSMPAAPDATGVPPPKVGPDACSLLQLACMRI